jgi:hypothetical protein
MAARTSAKKKRPAAAKKAKTKPPKLNLADCVGHNTTTGFRNRDARIMLQLETCCCYLRDVLTNGFGGAQRESRKFLTEFMTLLNDEARRDALRDYCYVQFDLKADQLKQLRELTDKMLAE